MIGTVYNGWRLLQASSTIRLPTSPTRHVTPFLKLFGVTAAELLATFFGFVGNDNVSRALTVSPIELMLRHLVVITFTTLVSDAFTVPYFQPVVLHGQ